MNALPLLGDVCVGFGAVVAAIELRYAIPALASTRWPACDGEITWAGVEWHEEPGGRYGSMASVYSPVIRYAYRVGEREYTGDRVQYESLRFHSRRYAQRIATRYRKGQVVKVRVSPRDPNASVLEPGLHMIHWVTFAGVGALSGIGAVLLFTHVGAYLASYL